MFMVFSLILVSENYLIFEQKIKLYSTVFQQTANKLRN